MRNNQGFALMKILPIILLVGAVVLTAIVLGRQTGFFNRAAPLTSPQTGPNPTYNKCVNNACQPVIGVGINECQLNIPCGATPSATPRVTPIITPTPTIHVTPVPTPVVTSPPTASYLSSFTAKAQNSKKVALTWQLTNQINIVGSNVLRSIKKANGQFSPLVKITPKPVPLQNPGTILQAKVKYVDSTVVAGKIYRYQIDVIGQNGKVVDSSTLVKVTVPKK